MLSLSSSCFSVKGDRTFSTLQSNCSFTSKSKISSFRPRLLSLETPFPLFRNGEVGGILAPYVLFITLCCMWLVISHTQQMSAHYRRYSQGLLLSKQHCSHWLDDAITQAFMTVGVEPLQDGGALALISTIGLLKGGSWRRHWQNCTSWVSLCPFILSCLCNLSESSDTNPVLTIQDSL